MNKSWVKRKHCYFLQEFFIINYYIKNIKLTDKFILYTYIIIIIKIISKYKISNFVKNQILQNIFRFSNHFDVIRISSVFSHFCSFSYSF